MIAALGKPLGVLLVVASLPSVVAQPRQRPPRLITVTGSAEVQVTPDEVVITLGVETLDKDINKAKGENDRRVKNVFTLAEKYGIVPKHVQTDHVGISPHHEYAKKRYVFKGYKVEQTIAVTLQDLAKYEALLTELVKGDVNRVHGVVFRMVDSRPHMDRARLLAIRAAKEKATALASELGQTVGPPYSIIEEPSEAPLRTRRRGSAANRITANLRGISSAAGTTEGALAPGQVTVRAVITVSFDLASPGSAP